MAVVSSSSSGANVCNLNGVKFSSIRTIKWELKVGDKINFLGFVASQRAPIKEEANCVKSVFLRILKMLDSNHDEIEMFVRGTALTEDSIPDHCVLVVQDAMVQRTNGTKSLRCLWISVRINAPISKVQELRETIANYSRANKSSDHKNDYCEAIVLTPISEILEKGKYQDHPNVAGLVVKREEPELRRTKAGNESWMRVVFVAGSETSVIELAVWGFDIHRRDIPLYTVIRATKTTVYDFQTPKTLSCLLKQVQIDPDLPETEELMKLVSYFSNNKEKAKLTVAATPQLSHSPLSKASSSSFTSIRDIKTKFRQGSRLNLAGIVINVEPVIERQTKSGLSSWFKTLVVADDVDSSINISIWGPDVRTLDIPIQSLITATSVTVRDYFGDKSVNCLLTNFRITDDFPEAEQIRKRTANYWLNTNVKSEVNDTLMDDECGFGENETPASVKYTTIKELLETGDLERKYNVVGLVIKRLEPISQSTKNARDSWMQMIVVTDDEDNDIKLTVWGDKVRECDVPLYSVISAQEVIVRQFNGRKTLSCLWSQLRINPLIPQIDELTNLNAVYLERQRNGQTSKSFKHRCNVVDIVFTPYEEILTNNNREIRYNVLGIVVALTPIKTIKTKEKKLCVKVITVIDEKPTQIDLAVWGEESMDDEILLHSAIIAKNVKLEEYKQQLRLSCFWDSMIIEPYIAEIDKLKEAALTYNVIPRLLFPLEFPRISEIKKAATVDSQWDIIGFVNKVYDSSKISREKSTSNEPVVLREIRLKDSRRNLLCLSIWGNEGKEKNIEKGSIIAVKGATVRIFDGKMTFNCYWNSVKINPDIPAVERLKQFKKDYENYRNFPERAAKYEIYGDYTPFEVIMRRNASTQPFHTIGLIVQVDVKPSAEDTSEECTVKSCILRDRNGYEINLLIRGSRNFPFSIPLHCLVAVRDASLSKSENLILICGYPNIIFNIDLYYNLDIPEVKGFKDAAMDALVRHEQPEAPKNFTAFSEINWRTSLGKGIKIVGIVVRIIQRDEPDFESPRRLRKDTCTLRVTLRDKNSDLISLNIKETSDLEISDVSISLHSVISVQDAILRVSFGDRTLWCCWKNVQINPDIAEKKELEILRELPFEGDYMSFKVIKLAQDDLIDYKMDIIGHVVEVLGIKCNNWRKTENEALVDVPTLSQMQQNKIQQNEMMETTSEMKTEKERQKIKKEEYPKHYLEVILRNQIDLKLRILGLPQRLYDLERILLNRIICARDAKVVVQKTLSKEFDECQTVLETDSSLVKIDPKILEKVGGANAVRIVPIEQIHSKARAGDVVGLLAIVIEFPKRIHPFIDDPSFSEESEDDAKETGRKYTFRRVKLLDSSGKKITMLIPIPVVASLRENISEIVVVHVTNLRVCEFEGQLEVEYTPLSLIKINSKIEETETVHRLLQWYKEFRTTKIKEAKVSKVSIKGVLENACRNKIVSIIGIFVNTYWREEFIGNVRVLRRLIQIVDTSQEIIDIVLRINQARMFNVPLFSVVMVENLIVYTDGPSRARGTAGPATRFLVNPTDLENLPDTQRLKNWFPGFWKDFNNSATNNEAILPESFELMKKQNRYLENIKVKDISKEDKEEETGIASDRELVSKSEFLGQDNAGCADYYPDIYLSDMNQAEASEKENGINQCNESVDIFADC